MPAPLIYVSAGQINAIVPYEMASQYSPVSIQVFYQGNQTNGVPVYVNDTSPEIFTVNGSGSGAGAILNQDSTLNATGNPAVAGSVVQIFATGEGLTNPPSVDGALATGPVYPAPVAPVSVTIGGQPAQVQYAGTAPGGVAGFLQVNATVPSGLKAGPQPIMLKIGAFTSRFGVTVTVQ
jgi:uncharacterized protein (TIGR03437 family)